MHFFCLLSVHWFLHQDEGWSISRRFFVDIPKLLLCCAPIVIKYSDNLFSRFFQTFMQAYCIDKYQSFCCYVLYSDRTIVSSLDKTHVSHMCPKITDETHCDAFCVKTATKKKRKGVCNNEHWTEQYYLSLSGTISYGSNLRRTLYCGKKCEKFLLEQGNGKYNAKLFLRRPLLCNQKPKNVSWKFLGNAVHVTARGRGYIL